MKKNILTIIVLAATLVNLTLTALMLFVYLPNAQKMNNMITKICQVIDMELENPIVTEKEPEVLATDLESYVIGTNMTINLTKASDGKQYYAQVTATVMLNKKAKDYATISPLMTSQVESIKEVIVNEIGKLTNENFVASQSAAKEKILAQLRQDYGTECIYRIVFGNYTCMN